MHDRSGPRLGSHAMKQPTFDWNVQDKYSDLKTFQLEVNNILSTYNTPQMLKIGWVGKAYNIWKCSQQLKRRHAVF